MRLVRASLLLMLGLAGGLTLAEIGLRLGGVRWFLPIVVADPVLGYAHRPGAEGWYTREGKSYVKINRHGMRGEEVEKEKPLSTFRIAVLGDSFTSAYEVLLEDTWPKVLERKLVTCPKFAGQRVEVLNFGVMAYGTAQELVMLRERVWSFSPDAVILAVFPGNDVANNSRALDDHFQPYVVRKGGNWQLDNSFKNAKGFRIRSSWLFRLRFFLTRHLRVAQLVEEAYGRFFIWKSSRPPDDPQKIAKGRRDGQGLYHPSLYREWELAWQATEAMIAMMANEVRDHQAKFFVVSMSEAVQVHPDLSVREKYMKDIGISDFQYPGKRLVRLGHRLKAPVVDLVGPFQSAASSRGIYFHGFSPRNLGRGHFSREGNAWAGEIVARSLCRYFEDLRDE